MTEQSRHTRASLSRRLSDALWRWCWRLVAFGLIVAAVLLTLARLLLPFAAEYRAELEQRVESYIGTEVRIGALDIGWHGFIPRVRLTDVAIDTSGPLSGTVTFEQAFVTVAPAWVDGGPTLTIAGVSLLGLELSARVDEQGRVHALGAVVDPAALQVAPPPASGAGEGEPREAPAGPSPSAAALAGVFGIGRLQLLDTTLVVTAPNGTVSRWQDIDLRLANSGDRHRLSLQLSPPERWGGRLRALLEFHGAPTDYRQWRARLYVEGQALAPGAWLELWPGAPLRIDSGRLDAALWSEWDGGRLVDARTEVALEGLAARRAGGEAEVTFGRIAARLRLWQPEANQWQLDVGGIEVRRNGRDWGETGLSFALEEDGGWRLTTEFVRLDDVTAMARVLPLPATVSERLDALVPGGEIDHLDLDVAADGGFRLRSGFRDVRWSPLGDIPGMTGLDGRARVGSAGGHVALESRGVEFAAPELFRAPLELDELRTVVQVVPGDGEVLLDAPRVDVRNADLTASGRVRVEIARGRSPRLDLQFAYRDGTASATPKYLPAHIMPPKVVAWLDQAFRAGRVEQGSFTMRGRAGDFPFRDHEGVFDVRADVAGVTLHYADGWPAIGELHGRVHFAGPGLTIRADAGGSHGVHLRHGLARIPDLREGRLQVGVDAHGPVAGMLGVINDSPLAARFARVFGGARGRGQAALALELTVPVKDVAATQVDGTVDFAGAALVQPAYDLAVSQLEGSLRFTEQGVSIDGLTGVLRGRPVRLDAATPDDTAYFRLTGDFGLTELVPALADGPLGDSAGRSAWDIVLRVPLDRSATPRLRAKSDLRGTRVELPRPLAKPAASTRPVQLDMPLTGDRAGRAHVRYGDDVRVALEFDAGRAPALQRLGLAFGGRAELPQARGIRVSGELQAVALSPWLDAAGTEGGLPLVELDLRVRALGYHAHRFSDVRLEGGRTADGGWRLDIASNEASGNVLWPAEAQRRDVVRARFDWIDLALVRGDRATTEGYGRLGDPAALPGIDLQIERLKLAETTLREFVLVTGTSGAGHNIHRLDFHTDHLRVQGQGLWRGDAHARTQLRVTVRSQDFGRGLAELGYPDTLANGEGRVTFDLEWPAAPWQPELATVAGHVVVDVTKGVLLQVNPGAARLLGMFSLEAIPFRTLVQKGLIFQELKGRVDVADGNAYTNGFKIDSAIGMIRISGRTGLVAQNYDQRVLVEPELASSLPVIGFLSGGPIAGVAIALIQGVMRNLGKDVERVGQVEYEVTGSWENPKVERVGGTQAESGSGSGAPVEPPR